MHNQILENEHYESSLKLLDVDGADPQVLRLISSVYSREDDMIRDNPQLPGPRVLTFNNILKYGALPLAPAMRQLLDLCKEGQGYAVEVEFAVDLGGEKPCLYVLQVRPQSIQTLDGAVDPDGYAPEQVLCSTDKSLGHGVVESIRDVVYVKRQDIDCGETPVVAEQVGKFNSALFSKRQPYLLVGPGRWGTSDPRLGIPVKWGQIAGAKVIVELDFHDRDVEPSQGTHFFHNVTSFQIGYLSLTRSGRASGSGHSKRQFNQAWLDSLPAVEETEFVRHVRLDHPLKIYLDGRKSTALVLRSAT